MLYFLNCFSSIPDVLITYSSIVETFFITLSVSAVIFFRFTRPKMTRPIRVPFLVPVIFIVICIFLLIVPCFDAPKEVFMGALFTIIGIPIYYVGVAWKDKPKWFQGRIVNFTIFCQKLFLSTKEENEIE